MRLGETIERVTDSWWPIPTLGSLAAIALAGVLLTLDGVFDPPPVIAFRGDPAEARLLLSTITSAMLSFIGLVFSVSIVVFTLASGQFSPRVLRTFLRDRWSQATLAVFVGTFVLALIGFWAVRGSAGTSRGFVPGLTITAVFVLTGVCVGLFVHFVHHITQEIRVVTMIDRIHGETVSTIDRRYVRPVDGPELPPRQYAVDQAHYTFEADTSSVVANVRITKLVRLARKHDVVLVLALQIGDFLIEGAPTAHQYGEAQINDAGVRGGFVFDPERSYRNDATFGTRKLIDIAERALSPGINDPTTAVQCIDRIHAILDRLAGRALDIGVHRDADGAVRVVEPVPTWEDIVALSCDELRHWGADSPRIHARLRTMLTKLLDATPPHRHPPLRAQLDALHARAEIDLPEPEREAIFAADTPSRATGTEGVAP